MADVPPPPPPPPPPARPEPGSRPPQVTSAGVIEITLGVLLLLSALLILANTGNVEVDVKGVITVIGVITILQGVLDLTAGILVLKLRPAGRILAIVMAAIGVAFAALSLVQGVMGSAIILVLIGITLRVLVIVFLNARQARDAFGLS